MKAAVATAEAAASLAAEQQRETGTYECDVFIAGRRGA
jgi:hypothetical protein